MFSYVSCVVRFSLFVFFILVILHDSTVVDTRPKSHSDSNVKLLTTQLNVSICEPDFNSPAEGSNRFGGEEKSPTVEPLPSPRSSGSSRLKAFFQRHARQSHSLFSGSDGEGACFRFLRLFFSNLTF